MKRLQGVFGLFGSNSGAEDQQGPATVYEFRLADIDGNEVGFETFRGKVLLIVNVASRCGFTKQYAGLESLYQRFKARGFEVLGFPANNFLWQEPGSNEQIRAFCSARYGVTFPMFSKISVRGRDCHPLYRWLVRNSGSKKPVEWNFAKFLIDRNGRVAARFKPSVKPDDPALVQAVEKALETAP